MVALDPERNNLLVKKA